MTDWLQMSVFSPAFIIMSVLDIAFCVFLILYGRKKEKSERRKIVIALYLATLLLFIIYKIILGFDPEYSSLREEADLGSYNVWDELPFNLCNVNMILIILGTALDSQVILGFTFFFGTLGALFPILMPCVGFIDCSILVPRAIGYYVTHFLILLEMPLLAGLDLYRPKFRDMPRTIGVGFFLAALMTGINFLLRGTGLSTAANYFFSMDPEGNPILELFMGWIPVPGLYLVCCLIIIVPYMAIINLIYWLIDRKKARNASASASAV